MAEISINITTFDAGGGSYRIELTKNDAWAWGTVSVASVAWVTVGDQTNVSPYLYTIDCDVLANDSGSTRTLGISVTVEGQTELFTITQPAQSALAANIIASSPAGNIAYSGGQITVDVESANGVDASSTAAVTTGYGFTSLTSTTHGLTSGGVTVTRFIFTVNANNTTSTRAILLTFTVRDAANNTAQATLSKTQNPAPLYSGSMSAGNASIAAADTSATVTVSQSDMDMTSVTGVPSAAWITDAEIQVQGGQYVCVCTTTANTGVSARTGTVVLSGDDIYGNTITATFTITQLGTTPPSYVINAAWTTLLGYDGVLDYRGGTEQATISYTGTFTGNATVSTGTLPTGVTVSLNSNTQLECTYTGGSISTTLQIPITITRTGNDNNPYSTQIILTLQASGVFPIWKDTYGEIVSDEAFEDYTLEENGDLFYAGRAFKYPDENSIRVNVSRVVAPYLVDYYKDVDMYNDGTLVTSLTFVRDYSYDDSIDYAQNQPLSRPINGLIPSGVKLSVSEWGAGVGGSLQVTDENGSLVVNEALQKGLNTAEFITGAEGKTYTFGSEQYRVVSACSGALLKYVNAYGGWDFLYVEGVCKKTDKITRASYEKDADALSQQFETKDYQATMEATWQGHTGWLNDRQSLRMKHLVESVEVYMLDLGTGDQMPVVMRDSSLEYKKFINGRKLVNYTLQWTESQKKLRR